MKPKFTLSSRRISRSAATLALLSAMMFTCGMAQGATHRKARRSAPDGKTMREAKTVQTVAPERREWSRLTTFNERFYPGIRRTFTTWW
jgi:hypothetical protein